MTAVYILIALAGFVLIDTDTEFWGFCLGIFLVAFGLSKVLA